MTERKSSSSGLIIGFVVGAILCVPTLGILAAIAIPSFIGYIKRSKLQEAETNLESMFVAASAYYEQEQMAGSFCTVDPAVTPNVPGPEKQIITPWPASFEAIGFTPPDPVFYRYEIDAAPGSCNHGPGETLYTFRAQGDLDGDGRLSTIELVATSGPDNRLQRGPGIYRMNELE